MERNRSLKILMLPAYSNDSNTYTSSLARAIEAQGHSVEEFSWKSALKGGFDVIHAHWVDHAVGQRFPRGLMWSLAFLSITKLAKARGAKVFLTLHNLESHEQSNQRLHRWFRRKLHNLLTGAFSLSSDATAMAIGIYPELSKKPITIVSHPHYREDYENSMSRNEARDQLGIDPSRTVFTFVGQIRPYKGVEDLFETWRQKHPPKSVLVVAGKPGQSDIANLKKLANQPDVIAKFEFVPDAELQIYMNAADLVVLPFRKVLNSGSALLALSFDRPVLVPRTGSLVELQSQVGSDWIRFYELGELSPKTLDEAKNWLETRQEARCNSLDRFTFEENAIRTVKAYLEA